MIIDPSNTSSLIESAGYLERIVVFIANGGSIVLSFVYKLTFLTSFFYFFIFLTIIL